MNIIHSKDQSYVNCHWLLTIVLILMMQGVIYKTFVDILSSTYHSYLTINLEMFKFRNA